ncbi:MAG TPA: cytochrome C oxidase subunit IV family protein [Burkholderiaceae bacterium]|jgi:caa(3)-type oxidase subunit IV|nr:cytochrome C oxidase subunit IV family protein [Burkholderiaceae bacterium]
MPDVTPQGRFACTLRTTGLAWVALLLLMLTSLGSAYLRLGAFNMVAGLVIAAIKCAIVAWLFMRLRESGPLLRLVAGTGLVAWGILVVLTGVDYQTRVETPALVQRPLQLLPAGRGAPPQEAQELLSRCVDCSHAPAGSSGAR